jgi:3-hydroxymyristoyl/3-hydroxydecanoyl-(acyl carrier protein) dehydratase
MDAHFRAFSFVDRITSVHARRHIEGRYTIPAGLPEFPLSLVGEAVGQLAAWAAMAAVDFGQRPMAGLAGSVELLHAPCPGQVLELAADIENVDAESVEYRGTAHADGTPLLRLKDCVGPMLPLADFDDPQKLRARFEALCSSGADAGGFPGLPPLEFARTGGDPELWMAATFQAPAEAPFFADHFPRRPVFPGSLLMHLTLRLGALLANEIPPPARGRWVPGFIRDMKLRSFIPPGTTLRLEARRKQLSPEAASLALETRTAKELIATASLVLIAKPTCSDVGQTSGLPVHGASGSVPARAGGPPNRPTGGLPDVQT